MRTLVIDGQRVAIAIEGAIVGVVQCSHHGLAVAEVDVAAKDDIEIILSAIHHSGKALPVGSRTDDETVVVIVFRTTHVEREVHIVLIVVPDAAASNHSIVDAIERNIGRYLHLRIFGGRHPSPHRRALTAHAISDRLAFIAVQHEGVDDFVVSLRTLILLHGNRRPFGIVGVGAARHVTLHFKHVVVHDVVGVGQINIPPYYHLAVWHHICRHARRRMEHGNFYGIGFQPAGNDFAVHGNCLTAHDHARIGPVHRNVDIARQILTGFYFANGDMIVCGIHHTQLGITQRLHLRIPRYHDITRTRLVESQHGIVQCDGGFRGIRTFIGTELIL